YPAQTKTSDSKIETAGEPFQLKLTTIENPEGMKADGADMVLVQVEVVDRQGRRCPLDNRMVNFQLWGEARWIGGLATRNNKEYQQDDDTNRDKNLLDAANKKNVSDNYVGAMSLPVECGVNRVLIRSTTTAGEIGLSVCADGVRPTFINLHTQAAPAADVLPALTLKPSLVRGETPSTPSYEDRFVSVDIVNAQAGSNQQDVRKSYDDNELTEWKSDGERENAWVTYQLARKASISEMTLKLTGWRQKCYPLEVYAGKKKVWEGITPASLGYVHISIPQPVAAKDLTIRMVAPVQDSRKFGYVKELAGGVANELDRMKSAKGKVELRIVEVDLLENAK
ncbi:MAG: beta-galactosidase, partial [Prevotella sp.]|nr:beta-galactosidase [Prevotella sp.]